VAGEVPVVDPAANLDRMLQPAQSLVRLVDQRVGPGHLKYAQYSSDSAIARSAALGGHSTAARSPASPRQSRTATLARGSSGCWRSSHSNWLAASASRPVTTRGIAAQTRQMVLRGSSSTARWCA